VATVTGAGSAAGGPAAGSAPAPAAQVVSALAPVRTGSDGTHSLSLRLQPEGLGNVDATVMVTASRVVVQLRADTSEAHHALAAALPQLRQEMGSNGQPATVVLSDPGSQPDHAGRGAADPSTSGRAGPGDEPDEPDQPVPAPSRPTSSSSIDLRL
jgi:hypothetical protein